MFEHDFDVNLKLYGCAGFNIKKSFIARFLVGDKAYVKQKARLGKIEKIVIKKILVNENLNQRNLPAPLYVDTFNRIWSELELINEETAKDIALIYWKNITEESRILFEIGSNCFPILD